MNNDSKHLGNTLESFLSSVGLKSETSKCDNILSMVLQFERVLLVLKLCLRRIRIQKGSEEIVLDENLVEKATHLIESGKILLKDASGTSKRSTRLVSSFENNCIPSIVDNQYLLECDRMLKTVLSDMKRVSFKMLKEDLVSMERKTVRICSSLGLQLDFLDNLQDMPEKLRHHRSLCDWLIMFLRNNYTALSGLSDINSLRKDLLYAIGFDPLSSAADIIIKRASGMERHINPCDWAEIFIEDEFKYNPFLISDDNQVTRSDFPFQSAKINKWFEIPLGESKVNEDDSVSHVNIVNLTTSRFFLSEIPHPLIETQFEDFYRGTDHESAVDVLNGRGLHLPAGRQKRDFSSGKGFYLTKTFGDASKWAKRKTAKPAILVFRLNHSEFRGNKEIRRLTLFSYEDLKKWGKIVDLFRSGRQSAEMSEILNNYDLIEGPVAEVSSASGHLEYKAIPLSYQMCLISKYLAKKFQKSLHSILFYRDNLVNE